MSRRRALLAVLAAVALRAVVANLPTTTRVRIDYVQLERIGGELLRLIPYR